MVKGAIAPRARAFRRFTHGEETLNPQHSPPQQVSRISSSGDAEHTERYLDAILRSFSDILFRLDRDGVILGCRAGDVSWLGLSPEQFLGRTMQEFLPAEIGGEYQKAFQETQATGRMTVVTYRQNTRRGIRWLELRLLPAADAEMTAVVRDATDHYTAVERLQRQLNRLATLRSIDAAILSSFNLEVTLSFVLREIASQLKVDAAAVLLFNPVGNYLEYAASAGFRHPPRARAPRRIGEEYSGQAMVGRQTVHVSEAGAAIPFAGAAREGFVSYYAVPLMMKGNVKGVLEIYHRAKLAFSEEESEFLDMIAGHMALAIEDARLFEALQRSNAELAHAYDSVLEGWARVMELGEQQAEGRTLRLAEQTVNLGRQMGIPESELIHARRGALLHNLGRLGIPDSILSNSNALTEEEREVVHRQPKMIHDLLLNVESLRPALEIPYCCHERWDGGGHPRGLKGEQIPLAARIFAVVEAWDTLTVQRGEQPGRSPEEARRLLLAEAGTRFDPQVVKAFLTTVARHPPK